MRYYESKREKELRLKRQKRSAMASMLVAFGLVILIGIALWNGRIALNNKQAEYQMQKESLTQQLNKEEQRKADLEEYQKYIQTKKFVEEVAKEKFGLLYPEEIVFKANE